MSCESEHEHAPSPQYTSNSPKKTDGRTDKGGSEQFVGENNVDTEW